MLTFATVDFVSTILSVGCLLDELDSVSVIQHAYIFRLCTMAVLKDLEPKILICHMQPLSFNNTAPLLTLSL